MKYIVKMNSLSGERGYTLNVEAETETIARRFAGLAIADHVAKEFGRVPEGIRFLGDTRTTTVEEVES